MKQVIFFTLINMSLFGTEVYDIAAESAVKYKTAPCGKESKNEICYLTETAQVRTGTDERGNDRNLRATGTKEERELIAMLVSKENPIPLINSINRGSPKLYFPLTRDEYIKTTRSMLNAKRTDPNPNSDAFSFSKPVTGVNPSPQNPNESVISIPSNVINDINNTNVDDFGETIVK